MAIRFRRRTTGTRIRLYCAQSTPDHADPARVSVNVWQPTGSDRWAIRYFRQGAEVHIDRDSATLRNARAVAARVLERGDLDTDAKVMRAAINARLAQNRQENTPARGRAA